MDNLVGRTPTVQYLRNAPNTVNFTLFLNAYKDPKTGPVQGLQDRGGGATLYYPDLVISWLKTMSQPFGTNLVSLFETPPVLEFIGPRIVGRSGFFRDPIGFDCVIENLDITLIMVDPVTHATLRAEVGVTLREFAKLDGSGAR